jgi:hypothetical protein
VKLKELGKAFVCVDLTRQMELEKEVKEGWSQLLKLRLIQGHQESSPHVALLWPSWPVGISPEYKD